MYQCRSCFFKCYVPPSKKRPSVISQIDYDGEQIVVEKNDPPRCPLCGDLLLAVSPC